MGPGDGNYDGNRYHKKPILRFGDFTDRFNANRMNRSQYAPGYVTNVCKEKCDRLTDWQKERKTVGQTHKQVDHRH